MKKAASINESLVIALLMLGMLSSRVFAEPASRVALSEGWATFGLSLPQGAAHSGLKVGSFDTQTDVKSRWNDGSIRFAVITCKASQAGVFEINAAPNAVGHLIPTVPDISVELSVGKEIYTAAFDERPTQDSWLSGPLVREWRTVAAPVCGATAHRQLRVIFDVRVYEDGQARLDLTVENVLDRPPASAVRYAVEVAANGKTVYSHGPIDHIWLARWRRTFGLGLSPASVRHDFASAVKARVLPDYWRGVAEKPTPSMATGFDLMELANLNPSMCDCGGRPEMAPYPDWAAAFLIHQHGRHKAFVLAHGEQAGSWPVHIREPEEGRHAGLGSGRYLSIDERPQFWFDNRGKDRPAGKVNVAYDRWGEGVPVPDIAHQPSLAFIPYLLTGDRYFMDEMVFWANFCLLASYDHGGARGLIHRNELRGIAWATRNLVDAATFTPDRDPVKAYLEEKLRNNLAWFDRYAQDHDTPLRTVFETQRIPEHEQYTSVSYGGGYGQLAWALNRAHQFGYPGGTVLRDRLAEFVLRLFSSEPTFPRDAATVLWLHVGPAGEGQYYTTMSELASANRGGDSMYAHWVRLALVVAHEIGLPGAQDAYDHNWEICRTGVGNGGIKISSTAGWAILPQSHGRDPQAARPSVADKD